MNTNHQNHNLKISRHLGYQSPVKPVTNDDAGILVGFMGAAILAAVIIYCGAALYLNIQ